MYRHVLGQPGDGEVVYKFIVDNRDNNYVGKCCCKGTVRIKIYSRVSIKESSLFCFTT